jgi:membrane fusion protein (multidrug efflux system)
MDGSQLLGYAEPEDLTAAKTARRRRWSLKQALIAGAVLVFLAVAADYGHYYWTTGRFLISTDDAYVEAHSVLISPKITGYISEVPVDDNQAVKAGQVLARIDPRDYQTSLDRARANVAAAQASIDTWSQQIAEQKLVVEQDSRQIASDQAALVFSQQDFQRYTQLAKDSWGTVQRAQQAQADIHEKVATTQHDTAVVAGK